MAGGTKREWTDITSGVISERWPRRGSSLQLLSSDSTLTALPLQEWAPDLSHEPRPAEVVEGVRYKAEQKPGRETHSRET